MVVLLPEIDHEQAGFEALVRLWAQARACDYILKILEILEIENNA